MNPHHRHGGVLEDVFITAELFRHFFSFKGVVIFAVIVLAISSWGSGGSSHAQLTGEITSQGSHLPIDSVFVNLQDISGHTIGNTQTDASGVFAFQIQEGSVYHLQIEKEGYRSRIINVTREMNSGPSVLLRISLRHE